MKKILLFLCLLIFPIIVNANSYKITSHLIDSEIEIAGGLSVKELIVVEGDTDHITRTINNYSFGNSAWDGTSVNLDGGTIYNSARIVNLKVSAFKIKGSLDFSNFAENVGKFFEEQDPKNIKTTKVYTSNDNKNGSQTINVFYPTKSGEKVGYYIEYIVSNLVVEHKDIDEVNYTFKNLDIGADNTLIRMLIPSPTNSDLYHIWIHGNQNAKATEVVDKNKNKAGIISSFPSDSKLANIRVTFPKEQVSIDNFINKSNIEALNTILSIENTNKTNTSKSNKIIKVMKYILYGLGALLIIASVFLFKYHNLLIFILYIGFGLFIMLFNYLFKYNDIYLYSVLIIPIIIKLITIFLPKVKTSNKSL